MEKAFKAVKDSAKKIHSNLTYMTTVKSVRERDGFALSDPQGIAELIAQMKKDISTLQTMLDHATGVNRYEYEVNGYNGCVFVGKHADDDDIYAAIINNLRVDYWLTDSSDTL